MSADISVIIITKDRPRQLQDCLKRIYARKTKPKEIIVFDQSSKAIKLPKNSKLKYRHSILKGKSKDINRAIKLATGEILAFTDDDCLPDTNWLNQIQDSFQKYKGMVGVFGRTLPYQPERHRDLICPSTFIKTKSRIIDKPCKHWEEIGFGNNMAYKREIFEKLDYFKEWLGPGSIGSNAEDAEFALRVLINGNKLLFNPKIVVYHNRWLTKNESLKQDLSYMCGEMACYSYYAFLKLTIAREVVKDNLIDIGRRLKQLKSLSDFYYFCLVALNKLRGFLVGLYFAKFSMTTDC